MARTTFDCLGLMSAGITPYTTLDSRSGVSLTSNGQMAFFGSSNDSGPLGMVFQHVTGNGVCRAEITSTRYGISGNDLSLNVDSSDPNTGGGLYIQYRGGVGIGTSNPATHNGRGFVVRGTASDTRGIIELHDGGASGGKSVLQQVGGDTYLGQLAKGTGAGNLHFLTGGGGSSAAISMTLLCAGNVGLGTTLPDSKLHICNAVAGGTNNYSVIIQNACTVADARAGIAFSNNSQTPSAGGLSGASIQTSNNGIDGTGNLIFGTLLSGTNTERMRISHNGNIGIGCATPSTKLHVAGGLKSTGTTELVWIGTCDGTQPLILTFKAIGGATSADRGMGIISTEAGLGSNFLDIGEASTRTRFFSSGNVNIGSCATTSYRLNVNGSFYSAGSSCEYKQSICQYNTDSCMFMKLKPVTYQYKDEWCHLGKELKSGTQIGLIAEDTAEVFPELAILKDEDDNKVVRNVDYEKLSIILLSEVQKLRKEVDNLKNNK
jgi:hypothetical protein